MKTHPITLMSLALATGFLTLSTGMTASPEWTVNGIAWGGTNTNSGYYRPGPSTGTNDTYDGLPNSSTETTPLWSQRTFGGTGTLDTNENFFNITTIGTEQRDYGQTNNWNMTSAVTLEFDIRVNSALSTNTPAGAVFIGNGPNWLSLAFGVNAAGDLWLGTGTNSMGIAATNFNTIRLTLDGIGTPSTAQMKVYFNNATNVVYSSTGLPTNGTLNMIRFGDLSSTANTGGDVDWQSVRWLSGTAVPVPEPGSSALLLGGLSLLAGYIGLRRRNRTGLQGK